MVPTKPRQSFFPDRNTIEIIHNVVIEQRGVSGYVSPGMIEGCIEFARTDVYSFVPYPTLLEKAVALIYAFITFHPYADGNKRTALVSAAFFLFQNRYVLRITEETPEFLRAVADRVLDSADHSPMSEIRKIADWLLPSLGKTWMSRLAYYNNAITSEGEGLSVLFALIAWIVVEALWLTGVDEILSKWEPATS